MNHFPVVPALRKAVTKLALRLFLFLIPILLLLFYVLPPPPSTAQEPSQQPRYVGARECRDCHETESLGNQYAKWKEGPHERAYRTLFTARALEVAQPFGLLRPWDTPRCLRCHVTGYDEPPERFEPSFRLTDGVQCESCHGAGSLYRVRDTMTNRAAARQQGLIDPDGYTCLECHNPESPTYVEFVYEKEKQNIAHPIRASPLVAPENETAPEASIRWEHDIPAALRRAAAENRPVLMDFDAGKGCPRCDDMRPVFAEPGVCELAGSLVCIRVEEVTHYLLSCFDLLDTAARLLLPDGRTSKTFYGVLRPGMLRQGMKRLLSLPRGGELQAPPPTDDPARNGKIAAAVAQLFSGDLVARHIAQSDLNRDPVPAARVLATSLWLPADPFEENALLNALVELISSNESVRKQLRRELEWDLAAFMHDPDTQLRGLATKGLRLLGSTAGVPTALRYAIHDPDAKAAEEAFTYLEELRPPEAVGVLAGMVAEPWCYQPDCPYRWTAAATLYALDVGPEAGELLSLIQAPSPFRPVLIAALGRSAVREALPLLVRLALDPHGTFAVRNESVYSLALIDEPSVAEQLLPILKARNPELRASVCELFGKVEAVDMVPVLVEVARTDPSPIPRAYALDALGVLLGSAEEILRELGESELERGAEDASPVVRVMSLRGLGRLRGPEAYLEPIRRLLREGRGWRRVEERKSLALACEALTEFEDREGIRWIVNVLDPEDLDTSRVAAHCLEKLTGQVFWEEEAVPLEPPRPYLLAPRALTVQTRTRQVFERVRALVRQWREWWEENG